MFVIENKYRTFLKIFLTKNKKLDNTCIFTYICTLKYTMMATKPVTTNLDETVLKQISTTFETVYQGMQLTVESFFILRRFAQKELKGIFLESELEAIIDMFNGTIFEPKMAQKAVLIAQIEDSETYEGTLSKWEVNKKDFIDKISKITETQAFFLMFEAWNYWYSPKTEKDLNKFIEKYI